MSAETTPFGKPRSISLSARMVNSPQLDDDGDGSLRESSLSRDGSPNDGSPNDGSPNGVPSK